MPDHQSFSETSHHQFLLSLLGGDEIAAARHLYAVKGVVVTMITGDDRCHSNPMQTIFLPLNIGRLPINADQYVITGPAGNRIGKRPLRHRLLL